MKAHFRADRLQAQSSAPRLPLEHPELVPLGEWLEPKEAAAELGMEADAFRKTYCDPEAPRVRFWERRGRGGGRRILVDPVDVERIRLAGFKVPA